MQPDNEPTDDGARNFVNEFFPDLWVADELDSFDAFLTGDSLLSASTAVGGRATYNTHTLLGSTQEDLNELIDNFFYDRDLLGQGHAQQNAAANRSPAASPALLDTGGQFGASFGSGRAASDVAMQCADEQRQQQRQSMEECRGAEASSALRSRCSTELARPAPAFQFVQVPEAHHHHHHQPDDDISFQLPTLRGTQYLGAAPVGDGQLPAQLQEFSFSGLRLDPDGGGGARGGSGGLNPLGVAHTLSLGDAADRAATQAGGEHPNMFGGQAPYASNLGLGLGLAGPGTRSDVHMSTGGGAGLLGGGGLSPMGGPIMTDLRLGTLGGLGGPPGPFGGLTLQSSMSTATEESERTDSFGMRRGSKAVRTKSGRHRFTALIDKLNRTMMSQDVQSFEYDEDGATSDDDSGANSLPSSGSHARTCGSEVSPRSAAAGSAAGLAVPAALLSSVNSFTTGTSMSRFGRIITVAGGGTAENERSASYSADRPIRGGSAAAGGSSSMQVDEAGGGGPSLSTMPYMAGIYTLSDLRPLFTKEVEVAARHLGCSATTLKLACRALGMRRWPQRKLASLDRLAADVREAADLSEEHKQSVARHIQANRLKIIDDPNTPVLAALIKLRDAQFKRKHVQRIKGGQPQPNA